MTFPYADLAFFKARTIIDADDVDLLATRNPGWIEGRIAAWSSWLNAQARKRYGANPRSTSLPFGQGAPELTGVVGAPGVKLNGRPTLGSMRLVISITLGGAVGTAQFEWSTDGGVTFPNTGVLTGSSVALGSTGLTATFEPGTYTTTMVYMAPTPVAEVILGWIVALVNLDVMRKRGVNPADPMIELMVEETKRVFVEVQQAADGKDGLWDLPTNEDTDSAVRTGGPLMYSEASPYVGADRQEHEGREEDRCGRGTYGGGGF